MNACILVKTLPTQTDEVLEQVRRIPGVRKAFVAYGRYDMVVFASKSNYSEIAELTTRVNSSPGVRSTETLVEA
jgi:DNA-binding Lrp family transcriptional regulator